MAGGFGRCLHGFELAELEQNVSPQVGRGRLGQRAPQVERGNISSTATTCVCRGLAQTVHDPCVPGRARREQVHSHLLRSRAFGFEHPRGAGVPALPYRGGQILVDGGSHQRVHEPQRLLALDQPLGHQRGLPVQAVQN